jgi:hypothetical protein
MAQSSISSKELEAIGTSQNKLAMAMRTAIAPMSEHPLTDDGGDDAKRERGQTTDSNAECESGTVSLTRGHRLNIGRRHEFHLFGKDDHARLHLYGFKRNAARCETAQNNSEIRLLALWGGLRRVRNGLQKKRAVSCTLSRCSLRLREPLCYVNGEGRMGWTNVETGYALAFCAKPILQELRQNLGV